MNGKSPENMISFYCKNFAITPGLSEWKVNANIPEIKLVRTVWIFREKIEKLLEGAQVFHITSNLVN